MPLVCKDDANTAGNAYGQTAWHDASGWSGYGGASWNTDEWLQAQEWQQVNAWQVQDWSVEGSTWDAQCWNFEDPSAWMESHQPAASSRGRGRGRGKLGPDTVGDERTAQIHFSKTYRTLSEAIERHGKAFQPDGAVTSFLDLGCAPGGFSGRLLEEHPGAKGFGVTLPAEAGGFPILLNDQRFQVQSCDLMGLNSPQDLECSTEVDIVIADAQDLGRRTNPLNQQKLRDSRGRGRSKLADADAARAGVGAVCASLGIWAMTLQELMLGLGSLKAGGTFFFRFGWRGRGSHEEHWYREATMRLFAVLLAHFQEVLPFKSEIYHSADPCFYVVASGFGLEAYKTAALEGRLRDAIKYILTCESVHDLPWCIETLAEFATPEMQTRTDEILDLVGRLRAIGLSSRKTVEVQGRESPEAAIWISPVPFSLTLQRLRENMERYGKIAHIRRKSHPIGVGADALIQFMQPAHATQALEAVNEMKVLGGSVVAKRLSAVKEKS